MQIILKIFFFVTKKCICGCLYVVGVALLAAQEQKLEPDPCQNQHDQHVGESEGKPAGKVDHTTISREEPLQKIR